MNIKKKGLLHPAVRLSASGNSYCVEKYWIASSIFYITQIAFSFIISLVVSFVHKQEAVVVLKKFYEGSITFDELFFLAAYSVLCTFLTCFTFYKLAIRKFSLRLIASGNLTIGMKLINVFSIASSLFISAFFISHFTFLISTINNLVLGNIIK